jgi:hypothetical protein
MGVRGALIREEATGTTATASNVSQPNAQVLPHALLPPDGLPVIPGSGTVIIRRPHQQHQECIVTNG